MMVVCAAFATAIWYGDEELIPCGGVFLVLFLVNFGFWVACDWVGEPVEQAFVLTLGSMSIIGSFVAIACGCGLVGNRSDQTSTCACLCQLWFLVILAFAIADATLWDHEFFGGECAPICP